MGTAIAACGSGLFKQFEYEEDVYISLDGAATVYVNSSIAALAALRGARFDPRPNARIDRSGIRAYFTTPVTRVVSVSTSRRDGRPFVHLRIEVDDVSRLDQAPPFAWSRYEFRPDGAVFMYRQTIGPSSNTPVETEWTGGELVAFRLHVPSKIAYHNALPQNHRRGNILVWEQPLADRLRGVPLVLDARMNRESILYRTLYLFGATILAVAAAFALVIWRVIGAKPKDVDHV
jgi:hypothetical protein